MNLTCIECKNQVDLADHTDLQTEHVIECNNCGITLEVTEITEDGNVYAEIVDEMK